MPNVTSSRGVESLFCNNALSLITKHAKRNKAQIPKARKMNWYKEMQKTVIRSAPKVYSESTVLKCKIYSAEESLFCNNALSLITKHAKRNKAQIPKARKMNWYKEMQKIVIRSAPKVYSESTVLKCKIYDMTDIIDLAF